MKLGSAAVVHALSEKMPVLAQTDEAIQTASVFAESANIGNSIACGTVVPNGMV